MSSKFYVGLDLTGFENNGVQKPVSRVTLKMDDEHVLTAGDDTGFELTADCPHATQEMVNAILAQVKGTEYQMYEASDINVDPAMELGDGITASGVYSVISRINDDGSGFPSVSAPGHAELEDEYPAGGPMTQEFNRKLAETRSSITKTAEQIRLEVERVNNGLTELSSSVTVELGKITNDIHDMTGNYSKLEQTLNSFSLSVSNGSTSSTIQLIADGAVISSQNITMDGLVTFKGLSDGTTTINGGCIKTGSIESISIKGSTISGGTITGATINGGRLYSEINLEEKNYNPSVTVYDGAVTFHFNGQECGLIAGSSVSDLAITSRYGAIYLTAGSSSVSHRIGDDSISIAKTSSNTVFCDNNIDLQNNSILNTSDVRLKTNVKPSDVDALSVINGLETYSFDWREDGRHENLGFIAQQLEKVCPDFVTVSPADGHYSTKDLKIIPYLVRAIQELSNEIHQIRGEVP